MQKWSVPNLIDRQDHYGYRIESRPRGHSASIDRAPLAALVCINPLLCLGLLAVLAGVAGWLLWPSCPSVNHEPAPARGHFTSRIATVRHSSPASTAPWSSPRSPVSLARRPGRPGDWPRSSRMRSKPGKEVAMERAHARTKRPLHVQIGCQRSRLEHDLVAAAYELAIPFLHRSRPETRHRVPNLVQQGFSLGQNARKLTYCPRSGGREPPNGRSIQALTLEQLIGCRLQRICGPRPWRSDRPRFLVNGLGPGSPLQGRSW